MLVDFTVSNFRSISEPATLSLIAGPAAARKGRFSFATGNSFASHVLRSAVILGPNGSGKTSLTDAFRFFNHFVSTSGRSSPSDKIDWPRNKLVQGGDGDVASFEATFVADGTLYEYGFKISENRVHDEWLFSRTSKAGSQMRPVFERVYKEDGSYRWRLNEARLPGMRDTWRKATRSNALFLSTAVQLNAESLVNPFYWITKRLNVVGSGGRIWPDFTARLLDDPATAKRVSAIIRSMDISFSSYRIAAEEFEPLPPNAENLLLPEALNELRKNIGQVQEHKIYPSRLDQDGKEVEFSFEELSDGEQVILGLVGPILDVLTEGETLVVDELSNSLHPLALRAVVGLFNNSDVNRSGAQLIFTSHEASLINSKYLHRDQIWFVENPDGEGTQLTPLSDFSVRESEAFDRGYLGGRYGALPQLKDVRDAFAE
jgi:AAA15 family ATPase/GTPase